MEDEAEAADAAARGVEPAWQRVTDGEGRFAVSIGVVVALALQLTLPDDIVLRPRWFLPIVGGVLVVGLLAANPRHVSRRSPGLRAGSMALIASSPWPTPGRGSNSWATS